MLKIAFSTGDGTAVDQHFGWCHRFDIYEVSAEAAELVESRALGPAGPDEDDKIESRLSQVRDCAILYVCEIGGTAAARVVNARIHPVKVAQGALISDLLPRLQAALAGTPPPWLRKVSRSRGPGEVVAWTPAGGGA